MNTWTSLIESVTGATHRPNDHGLSWLAVTRNVETQQTAKTRTLRVKPRLLL